MANLIISFVPTTPEPINGYVVKYRRVGDPAYTTVVPNPTSSPITIPGANNTYEYEGTIQADCSNGVLSTPVPFAYSPCIGDNKKLVSGVCETGTRFNVSSEAVGDEYACTYKYMFSDGSFSASFVEMNDDPCTPGPV